MTRLRLQPADEAAEGTVSQETLDRDAMFAAQREEFFTSDRDAFIEDGIFPDIPESSDSASDNSSPDESAYPRSERFGCYTTADIHRAALYVAQHSCPSPPERLTPDHLFNKDSENYESPLHSPIHQDINKSDHELPNLEPNSLQDDELHDGTDVSSGFVNVVSRSAGVEGIYHRNPPCVDPSLSPHNDSEQTISESTGRKFHESEVLPNESRASFEEGALDDYYLPLLADWCKENDISDEQYKSLRVVLILIHTNGTKIMRDLPPDLATFTTRMADYRDSLGARGSSPYTYFLDE